MATKSTPKKDTAKLLKLFADKKTEEATSQIGTRLITDDAFRRDFIKNPNKALSAAGLKSLGTIELSKRDVALLNLIGDKEINQLYKDAKFDDLQARINSRYAELVNPADRVAFAVADFDVAIEVEAVAVAIVAAAAIVVGAVERFTEVNVLQARVAALETRLKTIEGRIR